ncbi:hypothetical protein AB1Y20_001030 [Prymnesium parvum]|uniref:Uncharacterized protein n=1 Tax=Prymnesium parvum TaxID=97485 RepID=A0AB34KC60_PRYPA
MGGGKRRASSNMHGNYDVDTDKMSPAMAAAYAAALKAAGDLPEDATDEQRAAASQAIADALSQEPGDALRATQNHSKKSMGVQDAWQRLCELSENEDPQIVFEYCMEQLDTHEQLAASRERRRDRIETMERKMKEYNANFVAVRDFADARRQAFDEQARKVEAKYYAASIVCRDKRRRYVHISSILDTAENILQAVTSRVQHKLLMDKMPAGPRASAYKLSKNLDDAKRQLSEYLADISKAEAATEASAANNVDPVPEGAPAQAKQSALKRTGTEPEVLDGEGIEESLKAASSPEEKHAYFRIKLNEKLCNLVEFVTRMLQDMMRWDDEQRQQRQPYFAPQLEGRMARAYNLRISKEQLSATFRDHRFTKAPTMADEMAYALAAESPYADEASMFDNLDQLLYEDEPRARGQEKKSGKGGRSLFDQASTAMIRARRRSLRERERANININFNVVQMWSSMQGPLSTQQSGMVQTPQQSLHHVGCPKITTVSRLAH